MTLSGQSDFSEFALNWVASARTSSVKFPNDVDGDVLRSMEANGIKFDVEHVIDFNIDLKEWPPSPELISKLSEVYKDLEVIEPDGKFGGYILFHLKDLVTHDLVIRVQEEATNIAAPFGGVCESWGVWSGT